MSKIKNSLSVPCYNQKKTRTQSAVGFRTSLFLFFQLFIALLIVQPTAWAGLENLKVDANGDAVFNGDDEKLTITFATDDSGDDGIEYTYTITIDDRPAGKNVIATGPVSKNQTITEIWDGKPQGQTEKLPDGTYTIRVKLKYTTAPAPEEPNNTELPEGQVSELTAVVTLDTKVSEISIRLGATAFSPGLNILPVYYGLNKDVAEVLLEFQQAPGDTSIGQPIPLNTKQGSHTFNWNGKDRDALAFSDGQYTLRLRVKDKSGKTTTYPKTNTVTIDSKVPRITNISLNDVIPLISETFVKDTIQSISFTADADGGTPLDLTGEHTEIRIRRVNGTTLNGTLTYGNKIGFTLNNSLDEVAENGRYEVTGVIADSAGNIASSTATFTFDNVAPTLRSVATNRGVFNSGDALRGETTFVEATLSDNIELNLVDSSISWKAPSGIALLGLKTFPANNRIRWQLLNPIAADGLADGEYTVEIVGADKAGNRTEPIQISYSFDNLAPELVSLRPIEGDGTSFNIIGDTIYYNLPLRGFVATFNDGAAGTGVAFTGRDGVPAPTGIVFGKLVSNGSTNPIQGRAFPDVDNGVLTYILNAPLLKTDGSQDGNYRLNVKSTDSVGNTKTYTYQIVYDTQAPTLNSTEPEANETVSNLSEVVVTLNEVTTSIDFAQSTFRLVRGSSGNEVDVPVNVSSDGIDTATLTLLEPIALDGSDDDTYTIQVSAMDVVGNTGAAVRRKFYLVSRKQPQVQLITPHSETVSSLSTITVQILNYIGAGIDLEASTLVVRNPAGQIVPQAKIETDTANNRLTWHTDALIPRDGTADGEYSIEATVIDFAGQGFSQNLQVDLDTQFPEIHNVHVSTYPMVELSRESTANIAETFSYITVATDKDINFENSVISLKGPNDTDIAINRSYNSDAVLTLDFLSLYQPGIYTLAITPMDKIGNVSQYPFVYRFRLDIDVPVVRWMLIGGKSDAVPFVNGGSVEIVATLADTTGTGLALDEGESSIVVTNAAGLSIPGSSRSEKRSENVWQLIWRPLSLPTDGSADGRYTVTVTPKDKAGRTGDAASRQFVYDTQAPRIIGADPIDLSQPVRYVRGGLTYLSVTAEDVGPASLVLDAPWVRLVKPNGDLVDGKVTHTPQIPREQPVELFFTLTETLATDGSADGPYTLIVYLLDKAGNEYEAEHTFIYDSQAPAVESVLVNMTEIPAGLTVPLTSQQLTDITISNEGLAISSINVSFAEATRVDFANTLITLTGPDAQSVPLTLANNGIDQLTVNFVALAVGGRYTLSVTPQDIAGNTVQGAVQYPFHLTFTLPSVSSVTLGGLQIDGLWYINAHDTEIIATLVDGSGPGLALKEGESTIIVTGPTGNTVPGQIQTNGRTQLMWKPISLPTDGSADGRYTVTVTPMDNAGRTGITAKRQFIYDTQTPRITAASPIILSEPVSYVGGSLHQFSFTIEDVGPAGFDWEAQEIALVDAGEAPVSATMTHNALTQQLYLTLPAPFPRDGSADGEYTLDVSLIDKAGNRVDSQHAFIYDSVVPKLSAVLVNTGETPTALLAHQITELDVPVSSITVRFEERTRVDFDNTSVTLSEQSGTPIPFTLESNNIDQLTVSFVSLTQGGRYTFSVSPVDIAGNAVQGALQYPFRLMFDLPRVSTVSLGGVSGDAVFLNGPDTEIIATFTDGSGAGLALSEGESSIIVTGPTGNTVPGETRANGDTQLIWHPLSLPTDGSADGRYTVTITPMDNAGRTGIAVQRQFIYDTQTPRITAASPITLSAPVSYVGGSLHQFAFTIEDVGPAGFDWSAQKITLVDASEEPVSAAITHNTLTRQLYLTLPTPFPGDGSADGRYSLNVSLIDKAGNRVDSQHAFVYDSVVPKLSAVLVNTGETPTALLAHQITELDVPISSITVRFEERTRVDFDNTSVTLVEQSGTPIPFTLESNNIDQLTISFVALTQGGRYTLSVSPVDIAGNAVQGALQYPFRLMFDLPRVSTVSLGGVSGDAVFLNGPDTEIIATFTDGSGAGLALSEGESSIIVTGPSGNTVPGETRVNGDTQLIWHPLSLPTDGSADGRYTVTITPMDNAGRTGIAVQRQFIYDTQTPRITAALPITLSAPVSYVGGSLHQFAFTIEDVGPAGFDWSAQKITLVDASEEPVSATMTHNELTQQLHLTLPAPFPGDGSADGRYSLNVSLIDKAGNRVDSQHAFVYDSVVPKLSDVLVNTAETPITLVAHQVTELDVPISSITVRFEERTRVDFDNTSVTLVEQSGTPIPFTLESNNIDQLTISFVALTQGGRYTLSVSPVDIAGNAVQGALQYPFRLMFDLPRVSTVSLGGVSGDAVFLNGPDTEIIATFTDGSGAGLALSEGESSIIVTGPSGNTVPGETRANGDTQLIWHPLSLPTDGSADGRYTVTITPMDNAGRTGIAVQRQFIYDTQTPRITAALPITLSAPVSYVGGSLHQFAFTIEDVGPAGFDWSAQKITLVDASEEPVSATMTHNELTQQLHLTLPAPFPGDGSADGRYSLNVSLIDKAGNRVDSQHAFVYDSVVPKLSDVLVNTAETPITLVAHQVTELDVPISSITVRFEERTRVDFDNTSVTLVEQSGTPIPFTLESNNIDQLTISFVALTQGGRYTLSVSPVDIAGNAVQGALQYPFRLMFDLPRVSTVSLGGVSGDAVFLNGPDTEIIATFTDGSGAGLALSEGESSIIVTGPSGNTVPGETRANGDTQLIWHPLSLPTDGSADGRYTVTITPMDNAGRTGIAVQRQFIYDTQTPRITAASPITLSEPVSYLSGSLHQFTFTIEDVGPAGFDWEAQKIALVDVADRPILSALTRNELTQQLYLTLPAPFPGDGSADGRYSLNVSLIDKAGNRIDSQHIFVYDSVVPKISDVLVNTTPDPLSLVPHQVTELAKSISSITVQFEETTRVDFEMTTVTLTNESDEVIPLTLEHNGISQLTAHLVGLTQSGLYTFGVTAQDIAGNISQSAVQYPFRLQFILPTVGSVVIGESITSGSGDVAYANARNMRIDATLLDPAGVGLALDETGSNITVTTPDATVVPGTLTTNGTDLIRWEPITLSTDGSSDGKYAVYITPIDKAGRQGSTVYREFIYDTQAPKITAAEPVDLSQPVSYISESLTQLNLTIQDVGPADLELADQAISLRDASGRLLPTQLTYNNELYRVFLTLTEPLPLDGSRDGQYTVVIALSDKAGNVLDVEHTIVYDTQVPTLISTNPADKALITEDITQIQVTLDDKGESGIDWKNTTVTLVDPNGTAISGELASDGKTQLTLNTNQLVEDGRYIIRVNAVDRAGNGNASIFEHSFLLSRHLPAIVSTVPATAPIDEAFTSEKVERIEVALQTDDEHHLSTLQLLNPAGQVIAGQQQREPNRLIYNLVRPLATDGSEDGRYTIEFTPISGSGRSGDMQKLVFMYDTQSPEIEPEAIRLIVAEPAANNALMEIHADLTDNSAGIDWKNLDEEWITFEQLSPNATQISGRVSHNGEATLIFRLTVPLADNGSADGEYRITITPIDLAGNGDTSYEKVFTYDTTPPFIDVSTLLINDIPLLVDTNAVDYPTAISTTTGVVIQASVTDTGLGVDLSQSNIVVRDPTGAEISGNTQQNGVDTLIFKSDGLNFQGPYQVTVTGIGNDSERLGFAPRGTITTQFLYETTEPTATLTSDGGKTELTDEALPLQGTATDPAGTRPRGQGGGDGGEVPVPASGVWLVEIIGTGPDGQPIEPVPAEDESDAQEEPWSRWSIDFFPSRSGEYDLDIRVTDKAGNFSVYDGGEYTMSVSFSFRGATFGWPNPLRRTKGGVAFFSFDLNAEETVDLTLHIYDWSGDIVRSQTYPNVASGKRNDQLIKWNLENQAGTTVARGLYIFRLEAVNAAGNRANAVGKILVVD